MEWERGGVKWDKEESRGRLGRGGKEDRRSGDDGRVEERNGMGEGRRRRREAGEDGR